MSFFPCSIQTGKKMPKLTCGFRYSLSYGGITVMPNSLNSLACFLLVVFICLNCPNKNHERIEGKDTFFFPLEIYRSWQHEIRIKFWLEVYICNQDKERRQQWESWTAKGLPSLNDAQEVHGRGKTKTKRLRKLYSKKKRVFQSEANYRHNATHIQENPLRTKRIS